MSFHSWLRRKETLRAKTKGGIPFGKLREVLNILPGTPAGKYKSDHVIITRIRFDSRTHQLQILASREVYTTIGGCAYQESPTQLMQTLLAHGYSAVMEVG